MEQIYLNLINMCSRYAYLIYISLWQFSVWIFRSGHQRWVYHGYEPAAAVGSILQNFDNLINWTMAYRLDSDIPIPWGLYLYFKIELLTFRRLTCVTLRDCFRYGIYHLKSEERRKSEEGMEFIQPLNKTKMAAWFASHCSVPSKREEIVKVMQSMMQVCSILNLQLNMCQLLV